MRRFVDIPKEITLRCLCGKSNDWVLKEHLNYPGDMEPEGNGEYYYQCSCGTRIEERHATQKIKEAVYNSVQQRKR